MECCIFQGTITSAMTSEEENLLSCSDVAPEDARWSPTDVGQEKMSPTSQFPTEPAVCGRVASVSLIKRNFDVCYNSQGIHYESKAKPFQHV